MKVLGYGFFLWYDVRCVVGVEFFVVYIFWLGVDGVIGCFEIDGFEVGWVIRVNGGGDDVE